MQTRTAAPTVAAVFEQLERRDLFALAPIALDGPLVVENLRDASNLPSNTSTITVPFNRIVRTADPAKMAVRGYLDDPATGRTRKIVINITSVRHDPTTTRKLVVTTDRQVPKGARVIFYEGAVGDKAGNQNPRYEGRAANGLARKAFVMANRNFAPTNPDLFGPAHYAGSATPVPTPDQPSEAAVRSAFADHLDRKVRTRKIMPAQKDRLMRVFDDARTVSTIPDANLRAGLLSLAGTAGEAAIGVVLDGNYAAGRPFTIVHFSDEAGERAEVAETVANTSGRLRTHVKTKYAGEPFQALSAVLAHEVLHQDRQTSRQEEVIANSIETLVYAQQAVVEPGFIYRGTYLTQRGNARSLALLNSGRTNLPQVGLGAAATFHRDNGVFFGGVRPVAGPHASLRDLIDREFEARGFPNGTTPGNAALDQVVGTLLGTAQTGVKFSDATIAALDGRQKALGTSDALRLATLLRLTVEPPQPSTAVPSLGFDNGNGQV